VADPLQPPEAELPTCTATCAPTARSSSSRPHPRSTGGQALVFDSIKDYHQGAERDELLVDESTVLVVRGAGPKGYQLADL
jgi:dihydroxyacid dehydratase/phosphogluconate dehydratase